MTKIVFKSHADPLDYAGGLHVLTFAEHGYAPLDIHGRKLGVSRDTIIAFSDAVNKANEVGTMYPQAPISAVPRPCIRDTTAPAPLLRHLREFNAANASHMNAIRLLLDFSTPRLPPHAQEAICLVFGEPGQPQIEEIIVIRN